MEIIDRIFNIMKIKNIKNVELAEKLKINKSVISNWKTRNTNPPSEMIIPICELLEINPIYLLTGKENLNNLNDEEIKIINNYKILSERNKGKVENFIEERIAEQEVEYNPKDKTNLA